MSLPINNNLCLPDDVATLQTLVREQHAVMTTLSAQLQIEKHGRERAELRVKEPICRHAIESRRISRILAPPPIHIAVSVRPNRSG